MNRWVRLVKSGSSEHFLELRLQLNRHLAGDGGDATSSSNVVSRRTPPPAVITCNCVCGKLLKIPPFVICNYPHPAVHSILPLVWKEESCTKSPESSALSSWEKTWSEKMENGTNLLGELGAYAARRHHWPQTALGLTTNIPGQWKLQVWHKYKTLMSNKTTPKQSIETRMNNQKNQGVNGVQPDDDSDPQIFELRPTDHQQELPSPFDLIFSDIVKCFDT